MPGGGQLGDGKDALVPLVDGRERLGGLHSDGIMAALVLPPCVDKCVLSKWKEGDAICVRGIPVLTKHF